MVKLEVPLEVDAWIVIPTSVQCCLLLLLLLCSCVVVFNCLTFLSSDSIRMATDGVPLDLTVKAVDIEINNNVCSLSYLEVGSAEPGKPNLLLLHGQRFSAATWNKETGTMSKLRDWGYRAVALDLRDKNTSQCTGGTEEGKALLMHKLVESLMLQKVVIVSPSMSGAFSIPYVTSEAYQGEIAAYIPIAPVIAPTYKADDFSPLNKLRTLVVQGENDKQSVATRSMQLLKNIPSSKVVVIPDAGHPCYLNQPVLWHQRLKAFLDDL